MISVLTLIIQKIEEAFWVSGKWVKRAVIHIWHLTAVLSELGGIPNRNVLLTHAGWEEHVTRSRHSPHSVNPLTVTHGGLRALREEKKRVLKLQGTVFNMFTWRWYPGLAPGPALYLRVGVPDPDIVNQSEASVQRDDQSEASHRPQVIQMNWKYEMYIFIFLNMKTLCGGDSEEMFIF